LSHAASKLREVKGVETPKVVTRVVPGQPVVKEEPVDERADLDFNATKLIQFIPEYDEFNVQDIKEFDHRAFTTFESEIK